MIVVKVELWPQGDESRKQMLGTARIINDGTSHACPEVGNYDAKLFQWGKKNKVWKQGRVEGFHRQRLGPWDLLFLALRNIVGDRNP